jgi:succinate dehydrogenase / fumarate reductase, iron-sulfur subunit
MEDIAIVKIFRFDPTIDKEPRYDEYKVPAEGWKNRQLRETIRYIYENFDQTLAFRESCIAPHVCGSCLVMMNKRAVLACEAVAEKDMVLEPVPKFKIIKDLVVSLSTEKKNG